MKKAVLFTVICLFAGCSKIERHYPATYIYKNECSESIILKSYSLNKLYGKEETIEKDFTIKPGENLSLKFYKDVGIGDPLRWYPESRITKDSTIVILGNNKRIIHRIWLIDPLYYKEKYRLVKSTKKEYWYEWTFRDEDFLDSEKTGQ